MVDLATLKNGDMLVLNEIAWAGGIEGGTNLPGLTITVDNIAIPEYISEYKPHINSVEAYDGCRTWLPEECDYPPEQPLQEATDYADSLLAMFS